VMALLMMASSSVLMTASFYFEVEVRGMTVETDSKFKVRLI
jgi:hypothetical protein